MIIHDCAQNSEAWYRLRLGIPTASSFDRIITPKARKISKSADAYMHWLLAEWMLGAPLDSVETEWMSRGHELEPHAVKAYEFETGKKTHEVGFITTDDLMIGASPDRLVDDDGMAEIKCPSPQVHAGYLLGGGVEDDHLVQLQGQLFVASDRAYVDVVSYCPPLPNVIVHVERDPEFQDALKKALDAFVDNLLAARKYLDGNYGPFKRLCQPAPADTNAEPYITPEDVDAIVRAKFPKDANVSL